MLEIQRYLRSGKTLQELEKEFAISASFHPSLSLVILNYSQIDSPKTNPLVMEARQLILELDTWKIVSRSFIRFFNVSEALEVTSKFDWSNHHIYEKCDGSLISLFFYHDSWHFATRSTFANLPINDESFTWGELLWKTLGKTQEQLNLLLSKGYSYNFEFCSPWTQCVVLHNEPKLYLLDIKAIDQFRPNDLIGGALNTHKQTVDECARALGVLRPKVYQIDLSDDTKRNIVCNELRPDEEGYVLRDQNGLMLKLKGKKYLALHRLAGNGNIFLYKNIYDLVISGEISEVLAYFPACEPKVRVLEKLIYDTKESIHKVWKNIRYLDNQKDFALALAERKPPLGWILFEARRHNLSVDEIFLSERYAEKIKRGILELLDTSLTA